MSSISQQKMCEIYYKEDKESFLNFKKAIKKQNLEKKKYYCKLCNVNCPENGKLKRHYKTQNHNKNEMSLEDINII